MAIGKPISSQLICYFQVHNQPAIFPNLVQGISVISFSYMTLLALFGFLESFKKVSGSVGTVAVLVCFSEGL